MKVSIKRLIAGTAVSGFTAASLISAVSCGKTVDNSTPATTAVTSSADVSAETSEAVTSTAAAQTVQTAVNTTVSAEITTQAQTAPAVQQQDTPVQQPQEVPQEPQPQEVPETPQPQEPQQATAPEIITNAPDKVSPPADDPSDATLPTGTSSPNAAVYQDQVYVIGDSISHGFNVYNFVRHDHCLTQASVSMWNLDYFTFDTPSGTFGLVDAVAAVQPKLLYMSMGMNDVNFGDANSYATKYASVVQQIIERVPDINVVVAAITPIDVTISAFTSNDTVRAYNNALRTALSGLNSDRVFYYDAYSVVADPNTLDLKVGTSSGDGIHLSPACYTELLGGLYTMLDSTPVKARLVG